MKLCAKFFLVLLLSICLTSTVFALEPNVRKAMLANQAMTFDHIEKVTMLQVGPTAVITPSDIVSTNTAAVYYLPDNFNYPIELEIQNLTATVINYDVYSTTTAAGVNVPIVTDPVLFDVNGVEATASGPAKFVFYQAPNISFAAASAATATFIIRSIKGTE